MNIYKFSTFSRQQVLDAFISNGVDLDDPNAFIIDTCEGITGDWSVVSNIIDYLEEGEVEEFGIDQQGCAAKWLRVVKRLNGRLEYSLFDKENCPMLIINGRLFANVNTRL